MIDALIIGVNEPNFAQYVRSVELMGVHSGAYRDLNLNYVMHEGTPYQSLEILSHFYYEGKTGPTPPFHTADFLWPTITYLGSFLTRHGFTFDYVNLFHLEKEKLKQKLLHEDIRTIAITTTLYVAPEPIIEIVEFVRQYNPKVKIVVGGPYIANQLELDSPDTVKQLFEIIGADIYVINQQGEKAFVTLLAALRDGKPLDDIENIAFKKGDGAASGSFHFTPASLESNSLAENPVDYGLFPQEDIGEFVSLRTAISCPFSCSFCGYPARAGQYRYLDVATVEKELNTLKDLGVTTLTFLDDTFNVPKSRFRELLHMMIDNHYNFKWNSFYRSDQGDEDTIRLMAESGCEGVFLGLESGCDTILKNMNKTARQMHYRQAIPLLKKHQILTHANLIIGFPGETEDTYQETLNFIKEVQPDFFKAQLWYADPITPIWQQKEQFGIKGGAYNWSHNTMDCHTALDLIEHMFFSIDESIWSTQYGFQWSLFYLQRKGMSEQQVRDYARCLHTVIKDRLLNPGQTYIADEFVGSLKASCQFDRATQPDLDALSPLSAERYAQAASYWQHAFAPIEATWLSHHAATTRELTRNPVARSDYQTLISNRMQRLTLPHSSDMLPEFNAGIVSLALFSLVMLKIYENMSSDHQVLLLAYQSDRCEKLCPLVLHMDYKSNFNEHVSELQRQISACEKHYRFSGYFFDKHLSKLNLNHPQSRMAVSYAGIFLHDLNPKKADVTLNDISSLIATHDGYEPSLVMYFNQSQPDETLLFGVDRERLLYLTNYVEREMNRLHDILSHTRNLSLESLLYSENDLEAADTTFATETDNVREVEQFNF